MFNGDYYSSSAARDSSLEIGSYFWLRKSRATLPHQCPDRGREQAERTGLPTRLGLTSRPEEKGVGETEGGGEDKRERRGGEDA